MSIIEQEPYFVNDIEEGFIEMYMRKYPHRIDEIAIAFIDYGIPRDVGFIRTSTIIERLKQNGWDVNKNLLYLSNANTEVPALVPACEKRDPVLLRALLQAGANPVPIRSMLMECIQTGLPNEDIRCHEEIECMMNMIQHYGS